MLVVSLSVAAVLAIGVSTYLAVTYKAQVDTLKVKFEQAQFYADQTASTNSSLRSINKTITNELVLAKAQIEALNKSSKQPINAPKAAPTNNAKKSGRGRPSKKATT